MGLVQQPLVAQESGYVFIYAYLSWERAEEPLRPCLPRQSPVLLHVLWPLSLAASVAFQGGPVVLASLPRGATLWPPRLVLHVLNALFLSLAGVPFLSLAHTHTLFPT